MGRKDVVLKRLFAGIGPFENKPLKAALSAAVFNTRQITSLLHARIDGKVVERSPPSLPKRRSSPQEPPSLPPEKAVPILEGLIREAGEIARENRLSPKREEWIHTAEGALRAAFGSDDANVQAFGTAQCGAYSAYDTEEYLEEQAQTQLSAMVSVLHSAVKQLRWRLPDPNQVFLPAGSQHDAYVEIRKIIQFGTTKIFIIDPYVDHTLWPLLRTFRKGARFEF